MQREMQDAIAGDVASHRHHLLPFLWIKDAVITGAQVVDGREQIDVRFSLSAAEEDLDDRGTSAISRATTLGPVQLPRPAPRRPGRADSQPRRRAECR